MPEDNWWANDPIANVTAAKAAANAMPGPSARKPPPKISSQDAKAINEERKQADAAREAIGALDNMRKYNARVRPTGGYLNRAGNFIRGKVFGDSDIQSMDSNQLLIARKMREAGEGQTSDYEGKAYMMAAPGSDKSMRSNDNFDQDNRPKLQARMDRYRARSNYLKDNGTLLGADQAYEAYRASRAAKIASPPRKGSSPKYPGFSIAE